MVPTDTTSIREQPRWLYTLAIIFALLSASMSIWLKVKPAILPPLVHWRTPSEAKEEAARTKKPVLYVFSAEWCGPCKTMERVAFQCNDIAQSMNSDFIPVHVVDQIREKGKNPPEIEKLRKQFRVWSFPCIAVAPYNLIDAGSQDTFSTGNSVERALSGQKFLLADEEEEESSEWFDSPVRLPAYSNYASPAKMRILLFNMRFWHKLPPAIGAIRWKSINEAKNPNNKLPTLLVFVEDVGFSSDYMRLHFFSNKKAAAFINDNFTPVLVEIKRGKDEASPAAVELKKKYDLEAVPALVVLKGTEPPVVQDGFMGRLYTIKFLKRAIGK